MTALCMVVLIDCNVSNKLSKARENVTNKLSEARENVSNKLSEARELLQEWLGKLIANGANVDAPVTEVRS